MQSCIQKRLLSLKGAIDLFQQLTAIIICEQVQLLAHRLALWTSHKGMMHSFQMMHNIGMILAVSVTSSAILHGR